MSGSSHIELTLRLWSAGDDELFREYIDGLVDLLPRSRGELIRQIHEVDGDLRSADAVLVIAFPERINVDSFLNDPAREDLEDLAASAIARSLITDGRRRSRASSSASLHRLPGLSHLGG